MVSQPHLCAGPPSWLRPPAQLGPELIWPSLCGTSVLQGVEGAERKGVLCEAWCGGEPHRGRGSGVWQTCSKRDKERGEEGLLGSQWVIPPWGMAGSVTLEGTVFVNSKILCVASVPLIREEAGNGPANPPGFLLPCILVEVSGQIT